jgi:hypothetical protein
MRPLASLLLLLAATLVFAPHASADDVLGEEANPGTRPYMIDVTVGQRAGDVSGWNARIYGGWVPLSTRTDSSFYIGTGVQAAFGALQPPDTWARSTKSIGPEVRAGVAWGGRDRLIAHLYLSVSPQWVSVDRHPMLLDGGQHLGTRAALGISAPGLRRATPRAAAKMFDIETGDYGSASSSMAETQYMFAAFIAVAIMLVPDTLEVTYERTDGVERTGLALGYSI